MTNFLAHWYYGEGYPTYDGSFNQNHGGTIIQLNQTTSKPSATPFFESSIEFTVEFLDGTDTTLYVHHIASGQTFHFPITKEIYTIYLDRDNWVLNQGGDMVKNTNLVYTGLNDYAAFDEAFVRLYPNPTSAVLHLELMKANEASLVIIDQIGRKLKTSNLQGGVNHLNLNLSAGVYFVLVEVEGKTYQEQLIVQ